MSAHPPLPEDPGQFSAAEILRPTEREADKPWLCLVGLIETIEETTLLEELQGHGLTATLFVVPEVLVQAPKLFQETYAHHELGNGALLDATIDGELGRWTLANLESELDETDDLLTELRLPPPASVFLPGHRHMVVDGPYRRQLQLRYPIAVSTAPAGCSLLGARGGMNPITLAHTSLNDLAPLLTNEAPEARTIHALLVPAEPVLQKLRLALFGLLAQKKDSWHVGPLRDLLQPTRAYSIS